MQFSVLVLTRKKPNRIYRYRSFQQVVIMQCTQAQYAACHRDAGTKILTAILIIYSIILYILLSENKENH